MALDEQTRHLVFTTLQPVVGDEVARVVSNGLMTEDAASRADLAATKADIDEQFEQVDRRFEQVDHRFELMEAAIRELRHELLAAFRGELASQNRTMVLGMLGTAITVVLAAIALAQLL